MDPERLEDPAEPRLSASSEHDTTRREEELTAERLLRAQRLASLGLVATHVAHDFRALLIPIAGYAHALGSQLPEDPLLQQRAAEIIKAAELGRELVQQILTFAYGQARAQRPLSLGEIVRDALPLLRAAVDSHVDVRIAIDRHAPVVLADAVDVQRMLLNLVLNASRAIQPPGGVIEIGVAAAHSPASGRGEDVATTREPDLVRLTVADNGVGMSQAAVVRVLESFSLPMTGERGDGLGLWIVHQLVQAHGGRLWLESAPEMGTTVRIDLPRVNN